MYLQNHYKVQNPNKYRGNYSNVFYRSSWEKRLMLWLDRSNYIKEWSSEEKYCIVPYIGVDNRTHRYFIDFWIKTISDNQYLIEVKPENKLKKPSKRNKNYVNESITYVTNQLKFEAGDKHAKKHGMKYIILTEKLLNVNYSDVKLYENLCKIIEF